MPRPRLDQAVNIKVQSMPRNKLDATKPRIDPDDLVTTEEATKILKWKTKETLLRQKRKGKLKIGVHYIAHGDRGILWVLSALLEHYSIPREKRG